MHGHTPAGFEVRKVVRGMGVGEWRWEGVERSMHNGEGEAGGR